MQFAVGMLFSTDERYDRIHNHAVNFPAVDPTGIAVFTSTRSEHEDSNDNKGQRFCHTRGLIIAGYDDACYRRLAANHVDTRLLTIAVRNATDSGLGVLFDFSFGLGSAVPWAEEEATVLNTLLEFVIVVTFVDVFVAELASLFKDVFLNIIEKIFHAVYDSVKAYVFFLQCVTAHDLNSVAFQIATSHYQTNRYALKLIVGELESRTFVVSIIVFYTDTSLTQLLNNGMAFSCPLSL